MPPPRGHGIITKNVPKSAHHMVHITLFNMDIKAVEHKCISNNFWLGTRVQRDGKLRTQLIEYHTQNRATLSGW